MRAFLDEPTTGLDPLAALDFRQLVRALKSEGRTILITTHDMAEAESICDRVALIDRGRLLAVETPRSLSQLIAKHERIDFEEGDEDPASRVRGLPGVSVVVKMQGSGYRIELAEESAAQNVLSFLMNSGITTIRTSRPSLEEVYVHILGASS